MTKNISVQVPRQNRAFFNGISKDLNLFYLGDLGFFRKGKGISNNNLLETGHPCVTYGMLYTKYHGRITKIHSFVNQEISENCEQSAYGEILFPGSGETIEEIGKASVNLIDDPICVGGDTIIFKCDKRVDPMFLSYLLNSNIYFIQTRRLGQGYSVVHIYADDLKEIIIPLPPLPEQKKIAEILSTWDEAIELTQKKHSNLLLLKKGVAQKIINSPEWKKVPIRSLLKKKSVMSVPNSNQYLEIGDVDISTKKYTLKEKPPVKGAVLAPKGSILISTVRPTRGAITMISDNLLVSSAFVIVDLLPTISKTFIFSQLNSEKFLNNMGRLSTGSTYPTVNREDVLSYKVLVPPIEEQDSISEVMDNLTKSLSLLENKINLLKLQKQGLMQRLLTGKVRVKLD